MVFPHDVLKMDKKPPTSEENHAFLWISPFNQCNESSWGIEIYQILGVHDFEKGLMWDF